MVLPVAEIGLEGRGGRGVEMIKPARAASASAKIICDAEEGVAFLDFVCDFTPAQFLVTPGFGESDSGASEELLLPLRGWIVVLVTNPGLAPRGYFFSPLRG